jgi:hypothetical protein
MRTIPANLLTMLQSRRMFRATLVQVEFPNTTKSGVTRLGFTNHNVELTRTLYLAPVTFNPRFIVQEASYNSKLNTAIDDTELHLKIDDSIVNWFDIRTRAWHNAEVRVGYCSWKDAAAGAYIQAVYVVSNAKAENGVLKLELRGKERLLEMPITKRLTANCQHTFANARCGYNLNPPSWVASTVYALSVAKDHKAKSIVKPTTPNGFWYEATVGGTSGVTEPAWPVVLGGIVADGTVNWKAIRAGRMVGTVTAVTDRRTFAASGISLANDWFAKGRVMWLTGNNATLRMKVYSDDGAGNLVLEDEAYENIVVGDTFLIDAGCRKRIVEDCTEKFDNTKNAWAFPHLVTENAMVKTPKG